jgi:hypothetical protein
VADDTAIPGRIGKHRTVDRAGSLLAAMTPGRFENASQPVSRYKDRIPVQRKIREKGRRGEGIVKYGESQTSIRRLTPKLSDAAPVAAMLAAESAKQAAWVTLGRRSLERMVRLVPCAENVCERIR